MRAVRSTTKIVLNGTFSLSLLKLHTRKKDRKKKVMGQKIFCRSSREVQTLETKEREIETKKIERERERERAKKELLVLFDG